MTKMPKKTDYIKNQLNILMYGSMAFFLLIALILQADMINGTDTFGDLKEFLFGHKELRPSCTLDVNKCNIFCGENYNNQCVGSDYKRYAYCGRTKQKETFFIQTNRIIDQEILASDVGECKLEWEQVGGIL